MDSESELENAEVIEVAGLEFHTGELNNKEVVCR